jgi:hypothetical protein
VPGKHDGSKRWHLSSAGIAGLVGLVTGIVTLAFTLSPSLAPDPGNSISAKMNVLTIEPATNEDYTGRLRVPADRDPLVRASQGYIVYLEVEVNGRKRKDIRLLQSVYSVRGRRRLNPAEPTLHFRSDTPSDRWVAQLFIPTAAVKGRFFARYELYDRDVMLAFADTPPRPGNL